MVALAVLGLVVIGVILPLLAGLVIFSDSADPKPRAYRARLVVGVAIVAANARDLGHLGAVFGERTEAHTTTHDPHLHEARPR